jgi:type IV pilus assembly protein PilE
MARRDPGFTLTELLIVVAIMGILAAIAYPSYTQHIAKARRADCRGALLSLATAMERHFTANATYLGAGTVGGDTGAPTIFADECPLDGTPKYYDLSIHSVSATTYTLRATPKGAQAGDGILDLTETGRRGWDRNGDDDTQDLGEDAW